MAKRVYLFNEGNKSDRELLGGKGANLCEMTNLGLPVPFGFIITTPTCREFFQAGNRLPALLEQEYRVALDIVEKKMGARFGDPTNPLLFSVRSGAPVSMPGMMNTILNLGLNDEIAEGLARKTGNPRFAYDSYRRFIQMFANVVLGVDGERFEHELERYKAANGKAQDVDMGAEDWQQIVAIYKTLVDFPEDPFEQLKKAVEAVFLSWHTPRAIVYREMNNIPDALGTAVNVQAMVFGNFGDDSGSGVAFTRNPSTGEHHFFGEFLFNAAGEDVVAGIRTPLPVEALKERQPAVYEELYNTQALLEKHYRDMQDLEFTIQEGVFYMLQTRSGKRTGRASVKIAVDMVTEGLITESEALMRVSPEHVEAFLHPMVDPAAKTDIVATGLPASPGGATGQVVFSAEEAEQQAALGVSVILVRRETTPEDIHGMKVAAGILTELGGMTSHAAVVARGMGVCAITGCGSISASSPMFKWGTTLCIPTIFVSYTGEALDVKAPLLKALDAVNKAATKVCKYFDRNITGVTASLGCEQEYFAIDKALYNARPDLVMSGRTVFGHAPARGQQLDDHYFGSIPQRVYAFMQDFEFECHKLGIPVTTRHNEVAPSQFEVAPLFEEANVATDHNMMMMDVMGRVAERHDLAILLHEKPFAKINGSGKHNNWSLITNTGVNLFQPKSSARENLLFLTFFANTIAAVHKYADILRASIASAGNDYRLGANEAPPAIMSVFIGSQLSAFLDELENNGNVNIEKGDNMYMKLGIDKIPEIILDNTDRNRTSPFAFTGNKFEFRAVGSFQNPGIPMTVLNTIVAKQLNDFREEVDALIASGTEKRLAIINVLRKCIKESKNVRFEGDGYSDEWVKEAEKRGLSNIKDTPEALDAFLTKESRDVFGCYNVLTERELEARNEILWENYIMKVQIESRVMGDLALNHILPTVVKYQMKLIDAAKGLKEIGLDNESTLNVIQKITEHSEGVKSGVLSMIDERRRINKIEDSREKSIEYCKNIKHKYFDSIRYHVDKLELFVGDEDWPLVKYREMLFLH